MIEVSFILGPKPGFRVYELGPATEPRAQVAKGCMQYKLEARFSSRGGSKGKRGGSTRYWA